MFPLQFFSKWKDLCFYSIHVEGNLTAEGKIRLAYHIGLKLKNSGLNEDVIYARLEKQGFSEVLAKEVAFNVMLESKKAQMEEENFNYIVALTKIGIGVLLAIASMFIVPGGIVIPTGLIIGGIIYAILTNDRINKLK